MMTVNESYRFVPAATRMKKRGVTKQQVKMFGTPCSCFLKSSSKLDGTIPIMKP
jgi:hypothetical protein